MIHLVAFSYVLQESHFLWLLICFSAHQAPSEKGFTLKLYAPMGSKHVPVRIYSFSEANQTSFELASLVSVFIPITA